MAGILKFSFIGTGNAFAPGGLCWNGFVVNERFLFEAPPSAVVGLHHCGVDPNRLEAVVISHHHGDHFLGLPMLLLTWKYQGRTAPVRVVGPPGTRALAEMIARSVFPGVLEANYEIEWVEARPGERVRVGDLDLETVAARHDRRLSASLGFAARLDGRRFAYTGDSALNEGMLDLARHAEVLVSECASLDTQMDIHMNLVHDMPRLRAAMAQEATLLLTHLGPGIETDGLHRTTVARDFETYGFE